MPKRLRRIIAEDLYNLDCAYGADRNIEESDGGFLLFCTADATLTEVKPFFDPEKHVAEWVEPIRAVPTHTLALYLLHNDYAVEIIVENSDAEAILASAE